MRTARPLTAHASLFVLLSGADFWLTWRLLALGCPSVYELNPLAAWFWAGFGWAGLATFKAGAVALVVGAALAVATRCPRAAAGVLAFGWLVLAAVALYSAWIPNATWELLREESARCADVARMDRRFRWSAEFETLKNRLIEGLVAGEYDFPGAVEQVLGSELGRDPETTAILGRHYRLDSRRDCWAACLMNHVLAAAGNGAPWRGQVPEWLEAYRVHFRPSTPAPWDTHDLRDRRAAARQAL